MEKPSLNAEKNYNSIKLSHKLLTIEFNFIDYFILEYGEAFYSHFFNKTLCIKEG